MYLSTISHVSQRGHSLDAIIELFTNLLARWINREVQGLNVSSNFKLAMLGGWNSLKVIEISKYQIPI